MFYEIATLAGSVFTSQDVLPGVRAWVNEATAGTLLGIWHTDIGRIGELLVLRGFEEEEALRAERQRAWLCEDPFASASTTVRLTQESYALSPFLTKPAPKTYGGMFEIRTYCLTPGGLPGTMAGWKAAIGPAHAYTSRACLGSCVGGRLSSPMPRY